MNAPGYYRFPTLSGSQVVFVCEDDLWTVSCEGGVARRLTANLGDVTYPALSPDGSLLAFTSQEEGPTEVYVTDAEGGPARRITYLGVNTTQVAGWTPDGQHVVLATAAGQAFAGHMKLWKAPAEGGQPELLPYGPAQNVAYGPADQVLIGRHTRDPARWKRYRGGTCGQLWIDAGGDGDFSRLIELAGNLASPMFVGDRAYFISDHEGIGNIYSCQVDGSDLTRHTDHDEFYVRQASSDGQRMVYMAGGDLYLLAPSLPDVAPVKIAIQWRSSRPQCHRKFVAASRFFETADIHPSGKAVALTCRGRPFSLAAWEGPVVQHGEPDGVRYRLSSWLHDGARLVAFSDEGGEERLIVFWADGRKPPKLLPAWDLGRGVGLFVSPVKDQVVLYNHRGELIFVDLEKRRHKVLDRSHHGRIRGACWSPDGRWVAYGMPETASTSHIRLCRLSDGRTFNVTHAVLRDIRPAFDPEGKYLYFLSYREFDPVYDNLHFDLNFPQGMRPYLVTLQADAPSPLAFDPSAWQTEAEKKDEAGKPAAAANQTNETSEEEEAKDEDAKPEPAKPEQAKTEPAQTDAAKGTDKPEPSPIQIDLDGIERRIVAIPVEEGKYSRILGLTGGRVLFSRFPVSGSLGNSWRITDAAKGTLEMYDLKNKKQERWLDEVTDFGLSPSAKTLIYRIGNRVRLVDPVGKPSADSAKDPPGTRSGWLDLERVRISVDPPSEWRQMFQEAWRLQRDHFWTEDMSGVAWDEVRQRYEPLLARLASRSEFSDLMWEMQGELGTSHAYELGGDYRQGPRYYNGFLGADLTFDTRKGAYQIAHIVHGDAWDEQRTSPLDSPGVNVKPGDYILAIGGRKLGANVSPAELLVNQAGREVQLTVQRGRGPARTVVVKTLKDETLARYRQWVEDSRSRVHQATGGRVGYVHVPNMGPWGYAEFHRYFLVESQRDGLIVDVRFNGGGHVSQLILEKLARRRIGYDLPRWSEPEPYPDGSMLGPIVALTNERAGSDGDIFSHCFKLLKLGPLIGRRTWGGVIGINPRHRLVDGSITTQPEFSFWFEDVGWGIENYGTEPDIDIDIRPQDDAAGQDPQLERAIEEALNLLTTKNTNRPAFDQRPKLGLPKRGRP